MERVRGGKSDVIPVTLSAYLGSASADHGGPGLQTGAWNIGSSAGDDFSRWIGSPAQHRAGDVVKEVSRRYWELCRRGARLDPGSRADLAEARALILEAQTSCFLFWVMPGCHNSMPEPSRPSAPWTGSLRPCARPGRTDSMDTRGWTKGGSGPVDPPATDVPADLAAVAAEVAGTFPLVLAQTSLGSLCPSRPSARLLDPGSRRSGAGQAAFPAGGGQPQPVVSLRRLQESGGAEVVTSIPGGCRTGRCTLRPGQRWRDLSGRGRVAQRRRWLGFGGPALTRPACRARWASTFRPGMGSSRKCRRSSRAWRVSGRAIGASGGRP